MKTKQGINTEELVKNLLKEKIELTHLNMEKDKLIINLTNKLSKYEGEIEDAR